MQEAACGLPFFIGDVERYRHWRLCIGVYRAEGESVLIHGALGGFAAAFPGMAKQLGASRVVGTVRTSKLDAAARTQLPYDRIVDAMQLAGILADEKFDIVIDPVGGAVRTHSLVAGSSLLKMPAVIGSIRSRPMSCGWVHERVRLQYGSVSGSTSRSDTPRARWLHRPGIVASDGASTTRKRKPSWPVQLHHKLRLH
jgi:NADPH:quinone reductase-like Zn-dependent oxidoreductase